MCSQHYLVPHSIWWGAILLSRVNSGDTMPTVWGQYPIRPSRRVRCLHATGWIVSIVGAFAIGDTR